MRIWDLPVAKLCKKHLVAEHRELHAIWSVIVNGKKGYSRHPETMRWRGRLYALVVRHDQQIKEAKKRGWNMGIDHKTPLNTAPGRGIEVFPTDELGIRKRRRIGAVDPVARQVKELKAKKCECKV